MHAPILPFALAALCGVAAGRAGLDAGIAPGVALALAALGAAALRSRRVARLALIAATGTFGVARAEATRLAPLPPGPIAARVCVEHVSRREDGRIAAEGSLDTPGGEARARFSLPSWLASTEPGSALAVKGRVLPPDVGLSPGERDPSDALAERGLSGMLRVESATPDGTCGTASWIAPWRRGLRASIEEALPPREAGFARALALGERDGVWREDEDAFRRTGTVHVLVVAGLHLAMVAAAVAAIARRALARAGARTLQAVDVRVVASVAAIAAAAAYAALAGAGVSTERALGGAALGVAALAFGAVPSPWNAWAVALGAVALADPAAPARPAFALSFLAVAGILAAGGLGAPPAEATRVQRLALAAANAARTTFAAAASTAPALAMLFGRVPLAGVAANLLAVPLAGAALVPILLAAVSPHAVAVLLLHGAEPLLAGLGGVVRATAALRWASRPLWFPTLAAAAIEAAVFGGWLLRGRARVALLAVGAAVAVGTCAR
ncbi:MAG TPA: ComEC/Rec2 family competence protein, partial [bacterium]|nr:ComEC/Rec2 family competence protein [bacterium]